MSSQAAMEAGVWIQDHQLMILFLLRFEPASTDTSPNSFINSAVYNH